MSRATLARVKSLSKKRCRIAFICLLTAFLGLLPHTALAHAGTSWLGPGLTVRIEPATVHVAPGQPFTVNVMVDRAANLGAFQFDMIYDPAVVTVNQVELRPFLGSTGRTAQSVGTSIDNAAGIVTFGAFSFGSNAGPEGTGSLAAITLTAAGSGTSALNLQNVLVTDVMVNTQSVSVEGGTVMVAAPTPVSPPTMTPSPTVPPTATPVPTGTPTAIPTAVPTPTGTATATETAEPVPTATPTAVPTPTGAATATETAEPAITVTPTALATATTTSETPITPTVSPVATEVAPAVPTPTGPLTSTPTETSRPLKALSATPTPVALPSAPPTPSPSSTPALSSPLRWLSIGGASILLAGCIFVLLRWYRERHKVDGPS